MAYYVQSCFSESSVEVTAEGQRVSDWSSETETSCEDNILVPEHFNIQRQSDFTTHLDNTLHLLLLLVISDIFTHTVDVCKEGKTMLQFLVFLFFACGSVYLSSSALPS